MPECERCGRKGRVQLVEMAGARMYVCPDCVRFGKVIKERKEAAPPLTDPARPVPQRPLRPDALSDRNKELSGDYSKTIQRARERKGWSREDLGKKLSERVSIISKLENGEIHPSDKLIKKLEKTLEIRLMEAVEEVHTSHSADSRGMTLGDFIVYKNK
ncbi:MAG: multiprotein bridging factor aMBF1 [Candidatus Thermoplasmatota archaeon]|nr:multiprotein bridging factor aMBF1 [Candidatus Thermoplasmatota archaeon]